jgi:hypothetical protein
MRRCKEELLSADFSELGICLHNLVVVDFNKWVLGTKHSISLHNLVVIDFNKWVLGTKHSSSTVHIQVPRTHLLKSTTTELWRLIPNSEKSAEFSQTN